MGISLLEFDRTFISSAASGATATLVLAEGSGHPRRRPPAATGGFKFSALGISSLPGAAFRSVFGPGRVRFDDTVRFEGRGGSMIRHAQSAPFPVGPLPVAVIEPSLPALLVPPVGGSQLLPPRFPPASLTAVSVAPVTMAADPEHRATVGPPANPLTQELFAVLSS